jgi:hypothetical protein
MQVRIDFQKIIERALDLKFQVFLLCMLCVLDFFFGC